MAALQMLVLSLYLSADCSLLQGSFHAECEGGRGRILSSLFRSPQCYRDKSPMLPVFLKFRHTSPCSESPGMICTGAVWSGEESQGRVAVLGSSASLDDANIATYCNAALLEWLLAWLQHVSTSDSIDPSVLLPGARLSICW